MFRKYKYNSLTNQSQSRVLSSLNSSVDLRVTGMIACPVLNTEMCFKDNKDVFIRKPTKWGFSGEKNLP